MFSIFIVSLTYLLLISLVYFKKKKVDNIDNKFYKKILIINMLGLIIDICQLLFIKYNVDDFVILITNKLFLVYINVWTLLFALFVVNAIKSNDDKFNSALSKILKVGFLIFIILALILPIHYNNDTINGIYSYGLAANVTYGAGLFYSIIMFLSLIHNFGKLDNKHRRKYFPLFSFLLLGGIEAIVQIKYPTLLLLSPLETFVTILTYFFIENPDLAMIEQLNIARDQADRANQAKSEFLSSMSHEIRTPLNAIVGFSQALQEENLPVQAQEEVKDIVRASESLLELVNGILDISKIEANKIEIVDGEYNIYEVLNDLTALSKARMGDKKLDFKTYFDKSIPPILYGDSVRVKQIILNLLTNSIKYTKEGEVVFRVSSIQNDNVCRLIVSVEDTGIGIKKESIDKLFTKFQRLDLEKNKTIEGTGLGLAITKRLVDLMNGRIMVQSVYGKGSKFTVALDQKIVHKTVSEVEQAKVQETISEEADFTGKKVLIVDDNKLNLKVASRLIEKFNCEIVTLESGFDCIDRIKSNEHFDIILMDDMMPNMSGVETFHKLKEIENFNTPVIALTANAISGMKEKYLSEGFNDYLSKPIEKTELNKILNKYLKN